MLPRRCAAWLTGLLALAAAGVRPAGAGGTLTGETGLVNLPTTNVVGPGRWRIGVYGNGEIDTDPVTVGAINRDQDLDRVDFSVAIGLPWLPDLEIYSHIPLVFAHTQGRGNTTSNGGLRFGLKYRLLDEVSGAPIGLALLGDIVVGIGSDSLPAIMDRTTSFGRRETYEVMGILDRSLWTMPAGDPAVLTLNAGGLFFDKPKHFALENQSTEFQRRYKGPNTTFQTPFEFGAGVKAPLLAGDFGKLAWSEEFRGNTGTVEELRGSIPMQLFSGFRYQLPPYTGLVVQGGLDVALSGVLDPYRYVAGLTWETPEPRPPAPVVAQPPPPLPPPPPPPPAAKKKIVLRGVHFDFDEANIRADSLPILREAADTLNANKGISVIVEGHTDAMGSDAYNDRLSLRRATAVRDYLETLGVARDRMVVRGRGERGPVASNDTDEGRAQNRRVELLVE